MIDLSQRSAREPEAARHASASATATSRIGPLVLLPQVLRDLGFEPSAVLAPTGFDPSYFTDADMPIPYRSGGRMLAHCVNVTGCERLGLLLGEGAGANAMGLPGLLVMSAKDVGTGLRELARYMDLHDRGAMVTLEEDRSAALLGYSILGEVEGVDSLNDLAMMIAGNLMRGFCGESWSPSEVLLPRRRPADAQAWQRSFRAPVRFDADRCALRFPASCLAQSLPAAGRPPSAGTDAASGWLQALLGKGLVDELRRIVQCTVSSPPNNVSRVAQLLGMHERTLNRRLQAEGTSFRQVRDEVRYAMARQMLGSTPLKLDDVAVALGYAEASAFIHAFTRWSGQTPDQWRRGNGRSGASRP
jgi:AraC-like DNA-binding protein